MCSRVRPLSGAAHPPVKFFRSGIRSDKVGRPKARAKRDARVIRRCDEAHLKCARRNRRDRRQRRDRA